MPILKSAKKALRASGRKAVTNRLWRSKLKTSKDAVSAKPGVETVSSFFSVVDRAVRRHIIHRNKAARLKSQLSKKLKVS